MRYTVLDVETIPSSAYLDTDDGAKGKFAPLPHHIPVVVCTMTVDTDARRTSKHTWRSDGPESECDMLEAVAARCKKSDHLVSYNGRGFDMPLLQLRALVHRVDWAWWQAKRGRYGRGEFLPYHVDLLDQLTDQGAATRFKLRDLCSMLSLPSAGGGLDIDGAGVLEAWRSGQRDHVVYHCELDVLRTMTIFAFWAGVYHEVHAALEPGWQTAGEAA